MADAEHSEAAVTSAAAPEARSRDHAALRPFAEAVVEELTGALGPRPSGDAGEVAELVLGLVAAAQHPSRRDGLARRLLADPPLAAAFFQNMDLLYAHDYPGADAVSLTVVRMLELAMLLERTGHGEGR